MKKILAGLVALTTVLCAFTGCGKKADGNETGKDTAVSSEETNDKNEKDDKNDTDGTKDKDKDSKKDKKDKDDKKDGGKSSDTSYEAAINEYFDAANSGDFRKLLEMQMPDGGIDVLRLMYMDEEGADKDIDAMIDEYAEQVMSSSSQIKFSKIVSTEDLNEEDIDSLKEACSAYIMVIDYINKSGGVDKVDIKAMEEEFDGLDPNDIASDITIDDAKYVTIEYTQEGEEEPEEEEFCVYRINGGEWRVDNSMMAYMKKSKKAAANNAASSLMKAGNTALIEMDEEDALPKMDHALICSESGKNVNVPAGFDADKFCKKVENYFGSISELDWLLIIDNGTVVYSAAVTKGKTQVGTYPAYSILKEDKSVSGDESVTGKSFDDIYDICAGILK